MTTTIIPTRVAELSATLKPIKEYKGCAYITQDMVEEAEDSNSYNASFYCDGWIKPVFEGDYRGCMLQKVEDFQVLRQYYLCTRLEGLAYNEIPEDWDINDGEIDFPEMEITDIVEFRQIWFNQSEQYTINLEELINEHYNNETFVTYLCDIQDWAYEPKYRKFILDIINEHETYHQEEFSITYFLSPCGELLAKYAPEFNQQVQNLYRQDDAMKHYKSLKVAIRHHYSLPTDRETTRTYLDYLNLLALGKQGNLTNPQFVCPANIQQAHDRLYAKRNKLLAEQEKRRVQQAEAEFAKKHAWLLGIEFDTDHFHFQSLDSVEAYRHEGEIMHHCIYQCKYYDKHDYLSMHITDHEGNRVATCTVDLLNRRIEQIQPIGNAKGYKHTYGIDWHDTNDYKHIYNTLMARMHTFPKRKQQTIQISKVA